MAPPSTSLAGHNFCRSFPEGMISLEVQPCRLIFRIQGALHSEHIVGIIGEARAAGLLQEDHFSALVDMRDFTGVIDWKVIPKINDVMPKGDYCGNKNAYIVRDEFFAMLAKVNVALFPNTEHATFHNEEEAVKWLGWA
ncbi:hypothetical protein FHS83_001186 [Rhizomicrobium palustre]|uniref:STAS/SEC14 domain-containing protein n=1 Tax=Rhizomicrobium palustre TaxID=189966 RepID=A0A846MWE0_9PROT|nr:hypothetical protein [Rhizomicrobium palustre]NIK87868.1 hypothetical protein [Rhizomicrobium palustre]